MKVEQRRQCTLGCNFDTKRPLRESLWYTRRVGTCSADGICRTVVKARCQLDRSDAARPAGCDMRKSWWYRQVHGYAGLAEGSQPF